MPTQQPDKQQDPIVQPDYKVTGQPEDPNEAPDEETPQPKRP